MSKNRSRSRNPRVAVSKDGLVFWTADEDDALRHALKITPYRYGKHDWNAIERVCRAAGVQRSARMLRNRHLRMTHRKDPLGKQPNLCRACGLPRAGHTCRAVLPAQANGGYPTVVLRCKMHRSRLARSRSTRHTARERRLATRSSRGPLWRRY